MRKIDAPDDQIGSGVNVTGPLQIGNDWPGTFFRGDESGGISDRLHAIARHIEGRRYPSFDGCASYLHDLADTFSQCIIKGDRHG